MTTKWRSETIERIGPEHYAPLVQFFRIIEESGSDKYFKPHPFTADYAAYLTHYDGKDCYFVLMSAALTTVIAYGMLRGWDEGFAVPSLGIVVHPLGRRLGWSRYFMDFLHKIAKTRGAEKMRLTVHPDNTPAFNLYQSLGYQFQSQDNTPYLVGFLPL